MKNDKFLVTVTEPGKKPQTSIHFGEPMTKTVLYGIVGRLIKAGGKVVKIAGDGFRIFMQDGTRIIAHKPEVK